MEFSKYEATGNDFIILDGTAVPPDLTPETVRSLCERHTGIGADGVLVLLPSRVADIRMRVLNADGSEAGMCGNGVRAIVLFALDRGALEGGMDGRDVSVETAAGVKTVSFLESRSGDKRFRVDMGAPAYTRGSVPMEGPPGEEAIRVPLRLADGSLLEGTCVSMGNPHCVLFVDDVASYPVDVIGPAVETGEMFPAKTNVEFVEVNADDRLSVRVWERGVGETLACGTGACASVVAARLNGLAGPVATVSLPGGELEVCWDVSVFMTGPARYVFDGRTVG